MKRLFTFGCSHTNHYWHSWADILGLGFDKYYNFGKAGTGNFRILNQVQRANEYFEFTKDDYIVIDCYRLIDPNDYSRVWNDSFLKRYVTALIKRQWGQNLIKFQGVKLPGGIELNGRQIYDDAEKDLENIREVMSNTYELPPLDMIG